MFESVKVIVFEFQDGDDSSYNKMMDILQCFLILFNFK